MNRAILSSNSRVIAIGAHPDDIEYGCYGTICKLKPEQLHIYVATIGSIGDPTSTILRATESENALQKLNPHTLEIRRQPGILPENHEEIRGEIEKIVSEIDPDIIITTSQHDTHQEHRAIFELTISAARRSRASVLMYQMLSSTPEFSPRLFVDIEGQYMDKKNALKCHESQSTKPYMSDGYLDAFHTNSYALLHGVKFCETFEVDRLFN